MSSIYDQILDDDGPIMGSSTDYTEKIDQTMLLAREIANIPAVEPVAPVIIKELPKINILHGPDRMEYITPIETPPSEILSKLYVTTTTLSGTLRGVNITAKCIDMFKTNSRVIEIKSNFGHILEPGFTSTTQPKPKRKTATSKTKKERKKHGTGECFNSQITFVVATDIKKYPDDPNSKCYNYKFKIFQKNKLQLPGAIPSQINDIEIAIMDVIEVLAEGTKTEEIELLSLTPQLKNYKFYLKLKPRNIVDLLCLKEILLMELIRASGKPIDIKCRCNELTCNSCYMNKITLEKNYMPAVERPTDVLEIKDVSYTTEDTKLSLLFRSPIPGKPKKNVRVNIYAGNQITKYSSDITTDYGAKINILGGLLQLHTKMIYQYIEWVFLAYGRYCIVDLDSLLVDNDDQPAVPMDKKVVRDYHDIILENDDIARSLFGI